MPTTAYGGGDPLILGEPKAYLHVGNTDAVSDSGRLDGIEEAVVQLPGRGVGGVTRKNEIPGKSPTKPVPRRGGV
ncbi:MAG TPA: hypothetical protein VEO01_12210 [Pseudonocardiaceae bacterium]|nr:hypothetical protein [Pseudonocardiaceae bacterium]